MTPTIEMQGWADRLARPEVQIDTWDDELVVWDSKRQDVWAYEITRDKDLT